MTEVRVTTEFDILEFKSKFDENIYKFKLIDTEDVYSEAAIQKILSSEFHTYPPE